MPQTSLPLFPSGVTHITEELAFEKRDGRVTYFNAFMPVFCHDADDVNTFRMITAQFCVTGHVKQSEIARVFGIPLISVKRAVKRYRECGAKGFFRPRPKRGATVLTADVLAHAQRLLDEGDAVNRVAEKLAVKSATLRKALSRGRLRKTSGTALSCGDRDECRTTKSDRSIRDSKAEMGMGATNTLDRVLASVGKLAAGVATRFESCVDVPNGGILFALPALMVCGLLRCTAKYFAFAAGYYRREHIFLLLSFMALARLKSVESLRYCAPGEWGKILGLDRIPEVRTFREKIAQLSSQGTVDQWSNDLCRRWMDANPDAAHTLYVDGHVRVYNGSQTSLPRHYVARQRLCLRATTDYWVNAMDGQPFFVISTVVDPGLLKVLEDEIVPALKRDVPNQPSGQQLTDDPFLHRFCLVFDREGYSPNFVARMWAMRIACLTYHKYQGEDWPAAEFMTQQVRLACGETVSMALAERGIYLGKKVWVREVRKLSDSGHQTSILSTNYTAEITAVASAMFARWSQENFFAYMRQHYGLDRIIDYKTENIPDTTPVINPARRKPDSEIRSKTSQLNRRLAQFGTILLDQPIDPVHVEQFTQRKARIQESIEAIKEEIHSLKGQRRAQPKHIQAAQLPESDQFTRLSRDSKHFIDTVKMIAYRAETSMAYTAGEKMSRQDDARSLVRAIYNTEADIIPDEKNQILTVRVHNMANRCEDQIVQHLCDELNATETIFPGTNLRLVYELVSFEFHRDQEV